MVQRVEAALGTTLAQQANIATGARPDAVTQPGQPDKTDPAKNPPPKEHEGSRRAQEQGGRQSGLAALARNDPEIAKLLAARNAPMTSYTASAPTTLGQAAKTILALLQQLPDAKPAVTGRAPLLSHAPGQPVSQGAAAPVGGQLDPRAIQALMQRAGGDANPAAPGHGAALARSGPNVPAAGTPLATSTLPGHGLGAGGVATTTGSGLPLPGGMAGQLAMALSNALQSSGLFYESHLRDFTFGQRSLNQILTEPQAQAGRTGTSSQGSPASEASSGQSAQSSQSAQQATQTQTAQAAQTAQANAHLAGALLGLDPSTHALVRQQLETLANQSFAWQGEAWPGSELEWEVQRREPQGGDADQPDTWATRLKLQLPGLGEVQARLSLAGGQVIMHLVVPDGADLMADHTDLLRQRLTAQGLQLSQLTISRELAESGEGQS